MLRVEQETQETVATRDSIHIGLTLLPPILFSLFYFVDIFIRATQKYFWFDELVTLDVCRLPVRGLWEALRHGADFNPPLFFIVTKFSEAAFGETLIGMRVPEILGFWILCLCLYRVVGRRVGVFAGTIAMAFPLLTGAFYYSYEARPHAVVLGLCALAVACWQMTLERPQSRLWLAGFSVCLLAAFLMHCYALLAVVPFAVVEIVGFVRFRRINWPMWVALIVPSVIAAASYVPLLISYRSFTKGTTFSTLFPPSVGALAYFYNSLVLPCVMFVIAWGALLSVDRVLKSGKADTLPERARASCIPELILACSFLAIPFVGIAVAIIIRGPFFGRYFMSAVIGLSLLVGLGVGARRTGNWIAPVLAVFLSLPLLWHFSAMVWHRSHGVAEKLAEPSSQFTMNSSLAGPLSAYKILETEPHDTRPIGILDPMDFLYLLHYAPELRSRLYYVKGPDTDFFFQGFHSFHAWAPFKYNWELTKMEFLHLAPRALVYGPTAFLKEFSPLVESGAVVNSLRVSEDHFLAEMQVDPRLVH